MALDPATCTGGINTGINETCAAFKYWTQDQESLLGGKLENIKTKLDTLHTDLTTIDGHVDGVEGKLDTLHTDLATLDTDLTSTTNAKLDTLHTDLLDVQTAISGISGGGGGGTVDVTGIETRLDTSNGIQTAIGEALHSFGNLYLVFFGLVIFVSLAWFAVRYYFDI